MPPPSSPRKWIEIPIADLAAPRHDLLCEPALAYCFPASPSCYTPEAALMISRLHPIWVWGRHRQVVAGIRTYYLLANCLPSQSVITVGQLSSTAPTAEITRNDIILSTMLHCLHDPEASIYALGQRIGKAQVQSLSPLLGRPRADIAALLGISRKSLGKLVNKHAHPRPDPA